jgi:hypothetical protein
MARHVKMMLGLVFFALSGGLGLETGQGRDYIYA